MPLSGYEQRLLDGIETGLRGDDPAFAAKLTFDAAGRRRRRRRQGLLSHALLWLGIFLSLAGIGVVHDALAEGVLLILYGIGILLFTLVRLAHHK